VLYGTEESMANILNRPWSKKKVGWNKIIIRQISIAQRETK
jgi:hypothetical protein